MIRSAVVHAIISVATLAAQPSAWSVRFGGGLGVSAVNVPALVDYVNIVGRPATADRARDVQIIASLAGRADVRISPDWALGMRYERMSKLISSTPNTPGAGWEFDLTTSMPSVVLTKILVDDGASIEACVGAGLGTGTLVQRYVPAAAEEQYAGTGIGLLSEINARTPLDDHFGAGITGNLQWTKMDNLTNAAGRSPEYSGTRATLSSFVAGLQFHLTYQF